MFVGVAGLAYKNDIEDNTLTFHNLEVMKNRAVADESKSRNNTCKKTNLFFGFVVNVNVKQNVTGPHAENELGVEMEYVIQSDNEVDLYQDNSDEDPDFCPTGESCTEDEDNYMDNKGGSAENSCCRNNNEEEKTITHNKKRLKNENQWKVNKRKRSTLAGKEHFSKTGKKNCSKEDQTWLQTM